MLIGSRAIKYHWDRIHPGQTAFKVKEGSDWDIIGESVSEQFYRSLFKIPDKDRIEWHDPKHLNNNSMLYYFRCEDVCNLYGLALIYRSHLWRDYKWDSHIAKYHLFIIPLLGNLKHLDDPLMKERIKLTKEAYPQGNPNLMQANEDFFDDNVKKVYDHDYLHELLAYEERPMFEKLKRPEGFESAWCEKDLWLGLSDTNKLQCVAEETQVIAAERFLIPTNWEGNYKQAYYKALKKVCTTLCSGWFRDYTIDHFPQVVDMFDPDRFYKVAAILDTDKNVKLFKGD